MNVSKKDSLCNITLNRQLIKETFGNEFKFGAKIFNVIGYTHWSDFEQDNGWVYIYLVGYGETTGISIAFRRDENTSTLELDLLPMKTSLYNGIFNNDKLNKDLSNKFLEKVRLVLARENCNAIRNYTINSVKRINTEVKG